MQRASPFHEAGRSALDRIRKGAGDGVGSKKHCWVCRHRIVFRQRRARRQHDNRTTRARLRICATTHACARDRGIPSARTRFASYGVAGRRGARCDAAPWRRSMELATSCTAWMTTGICTNSTGGEQMSRPSCTTIRECCPPIHEGRPARPPASADTAAHAAAPIRRCDYVALVSCPSSGAAVSQARRERSACLPRLAWGVVADRELLEATLSSYHRVRVQHIGLHPLYPLSSRSPRAPTWYATHVSPSASHATELQDNESPACCD